MSTTIIGFPRLGEFRELKFTTEKYFRKEISEEELLAAAKDLRAKHWNIVKEKGITEIPSNDFSHYDNFLDAASFSTWYLLQFKTWTCLTLSATSLWVVVTKEKRGRSRAPNEEMVQHQTPLHRS